VRGREEHVDVRLGGLPGFRGRARAAAHWAAPWVMGMADRSHAGPRTRQSLPEPSPCQKDFVFSGPPEFKTRVDGLVGLKAAPSSVSRSDVLLRRRTGARVRWPGVNRARQPHLLFRPDGDIDE